MSIFCYRTSNCETLTLNIPQVLVIKRNADSRLGAHGGGPFVLEGVGGRGGELLVRHVINPARSSGCASLLAASLAAQPRVRLRNLKYWIFEENHAKI